MYTIQTFTSNNEKQLSIFKQEEEMHYTCFVADGDDSYKGRLSLWPNNNDKVYIEICNNENPEDLYSMQHIVLGKEDCVKLISELQRIITEYEIS